ncbi:MAG: RidA family protein [Mariprofundaceae bacterium]|nr:RidA family protein [Mariprofundaceae bacterium]
MNIIHSEHAPKAVGPYSQAIAHDGILYASGQIGLLPETSQMIEGGVEAQAKQVTQNLSAVLEASGGSVNDIIKVTIFLLDMNDFPRVNAIYAAWLGEHRPARATVAVLALPLGAQVEMDLIARLPA